MNNSWAYQLIMAFYLLIKKAFFRRAKYLTRTNGVYSLILILMVWPVVVNAQPDLTLNELIQLAIKQNKDLRTARYNVAIASARLVQAGLWSNPSLNLSNNDDKFFNNEGEYSRTVGFTQAFPISGRIAKQKTVARLDVERAIAEIREAERQLSAKVANAYYAIVVTERRFQQINYLQDINRELVNVIHNRYHAAEVSELDDNSARIEYQRIEQDKHLLHSLRISQYAALNQLLGRQADEPLIVKLEKKIHPKLPDLQALQASALQHRPDRQSLLLAVNQANATRRLARANRFADWTLGVGVQQDRIFVEGGVAQPPDRTLGVTLSIPLPILNANQGRILEASATETQATMALRALSLVIETEVTSNYAQLKALQSSLLQTKNTSLRLGLDNVKLARDAYQNGQISLLNVLQIQRQQNDLQITYLNTLEKYFQVYVALCTAMGSGQPQGLCSYLANQRSHNDYQLAK